MLIKWDITPKARSGTPEELKKRIETERPMTLPARALEIMKVAITIKGVEISNNRSFNY